VLDKKSENNPHTAAQNVKQASASRPTTRNWTFQQITEMWQTGVGTNM